MIDNHAQKTAVHFVESRLIDVEAIERLSEYTPRLRRDISEMAMRYNINIIAGSHPTRMEDGDIHNVAYVCLRDGAVHAQEKIHPTPNERYWWNIKGGDKVKKKHELLFVSTPIRAGQRLTST